MPLALYYNPRTSTTAGREDSDEKIRTFCERDLPSLFWNSFFSLFLPESAGPDARAENRDESCLAGADIAYQEQLRVRLTQIHSASNKKYLALREQLRGSKEGSADPGQHKVYVQNYYAEVNKVKTAARQAKVQGTIELNTARLDNRQQNEQSCAGQ